MWWPNAEWRPCLPTGPSPQPWREKGHSLTTPGSCGVSGRTHLPRTKQNSQRFFPVSDPRKLPALSSAPHRYTLSTSQSFSFSWHFSSHPFSFVSPSVWADLFPCLSRGCRPCLCLSLPPPWPVLAGSATFPFSSPGLCRAMW